MRWLLFKCLDCNLLITCKHNVTRNGWENICTCTVECVCRYKMDFFFLLFCLYFLFYVYLKNIHSAVGIIAYIRSQQLLFALNCSEKHIFYWLGMQLLCLEIVALSSKTSGFRRSICRLDMALGRGGEKSRWNCFRGSSSQCRTIEWNSSPPSLKYTPFFTCSFLNSVLIFCLSLTVLIWQFSYLHLNPKPKGCCFWQCQFSRAMALVQTGREWH